MAYLQVADFKYGLDRKRPRVAGVPGTLWVLKNGQISRGGDIERVKKFVPTFTGLANTFGLGQIGGQLWVFGSADLAASMPAAVQYQRLQAPSAAAMARVLFNNTFDGKHYVIAEYDDGSIHHFYDGTRIAGWDTLSEDNSNATTLAAYLARKVGTNAAVDAISSGPNIILTASEPGTAFSISASATNGGAANDQTLTVTQLQANVTAVDEVRATGTVTITGGTLDPSVNRVTGVTVNGVQLLGVPVHWRDSHIATATALAVEINNRTSVHGYIASPAGPVVTIRAPIGTGSTPNTYVVVATTSGDVTALTANFSGGVTAVEPVAQIEKATLGGTWEPQDVYTITVNGTAYKATGRASGHGTSAYVYKKREYFTAGSLLRYSKLNTANDVTDAAASSGAGFINMSNESEGSERLVAVMQYQADVAIFARSSIRIYNLNTDATANAYVQTLDNTGTIAPRSVLSYGNTDTFYLDDSGIRSLQVRDMTNAAFVNDVGSAIDPHVQEWVAGLTEDVIEHAVAAIEPLDGRFFLAIGARVYVLNYFPASKINAWSYMEPGFTISDFRRVNKRLYARDGSTIYAYGGLTGRVYPDAGELETEVETSFLNAKTIATLKDLKGFDMACSGEWDVKILVNPDDETQLVNVGKITKSTHNVGDIGIVGECAYFALRFVCSAAGNATLSSFAVHYDPAKAG